MRVEKWQIAEQSVRRALGQARNALAKHVGLPPTSELVIVLPHDIGVLHHAIAEKFGEHQDLGYTDRTGSLADLVQFNFHQENVTVAYPPREPDMLVDALAELGAHVIATDTAHPAAVHAHRTVAAHLAASPVKSRMYAAAILTGLGAVLRGHATSAPTLPWLGIEPAAAA